MLTESVVDTRVAVMKHAVRHAAWATPVVPGGAGNQGRSPNSGKFTENNTSDRRHRRRHRGRGDNAIADPTRAERHGH